MDKYREKDIIVKIQGGEINFFETLVNKYSKIIYFYTLRKVKNPKDAEDIVQNTFINAYKAIERFDADRSYYAFLFSILKNEIAGFFRSCYNHKNLQLEEEILINENSLEIENMDLELLLKGLKKDYAKVLQLYYIHGLSYKEISDKLQKPLNTIKTLLSRAKKEARKTYEK